MKFYASTVLAAIFVCVAVVSDTSAATSTPATTSSKVTTIRERGFILCGIRNDVPGFSVVDSKGKWSGLNVDFCAALAAAVLGKKDAVQYRPLSSEQRYRALAAGEVDVVVGGNVWTLSRDTELGVRFVDTLFHDGQVFLVRREMAVSSALELSGTSVCALKGTRAGQNAARYFGSRQMGYKLISKSHWEEAVTAYKSGACNVLTGDMSVLAAERMKLPDPGAHQILREVVSKEPLGPAVKSGEEIWFSIVRWTLMALLEAEELDITSENIASFKFSKVARVRRLLGLETNLGDQMGLTRDWAHQVILQVGNYAQIYERNVGAASPLKLPRGINSLWNKGGLMYGVPLR